jgi:DHA3 family macrolide efflux protein-like MFS transporter
MEEIANQNTYKSYIFLWSGQLFSLLGSSIIQFVLLVWVVDVTGSMSMVALANFFYLFPILIITPIAGVWADRYDRRIIILIADSIQAYLTVLLTIFFLLDAATIEIVFIFMGLRSIFQSIHSPTIMAIFPSMVPKDNLSRMNGINFFFTGIINLIGAPIAATFLFFFPIKIILWIDVLTFFIALVPLLLVSVPKVHIQNSINEKNSLIQELKLGLGTIHKVPGLLKILFVAMLFNFLLQPLFVLMTYYIKIFHGGSNFELALISMSIEGSTLIGAILVSVKKQWNHKMFVCFFGLLVASTGYLLYALAPIKAYAIMGLGMVLIGILLPVINTLLITIVQSIIPHDKMGRVSSIIQVISMVIAPVGAIISGPLGEVFGINYLYIYSAILALLITIIMYSFSNLRHINYDEIQIEFAE